MKKYYTDGGLMKKCNYVKDVCADCGRPKGWRVHRRHRGPRYAACPGRRAV